jgi:hypothetical protein
MLRIKVNGSDNIKTRLHTAHSHGREPVTRRRGWLNWIGRRWPLLLTVTFGIWLGLPWLAPVLMKLGWTTAAEFIYFLYALQCHQLPQRSFFLFGEKSMYSLAEIQAAWHVTEDPLVLRQFVGNTEMGWKVAWSDRMVYMYTSILFFGWLYRPLRRRVRPLPLWAIALFFVPLAIDGGSHVVSDLSGLSSGFRAGNEWLAALTGYVFPTAFYAGDALGSFNAWMRLLTGLLVGIGLAWLACPFLEEAWLRTKRDENSL